MNNFKRKLELLNKEDLIWLIYYFIVTFAVIANNLRKKYYYTYDLKSLNLSKGIVTTILIVALFIYLYFVITTIDNIKLIKENISNDNIRVEMERLVSATLFLAGGIIAILANIDANTSNIDIGFF